MNNRFYRHRILAVGLMISMLVVAVVPRPTTSAQFVIARWDYPDEYGQGIEIIYYQIRFANDSNKEWGYTYPTNATHSYKVPENGTVYLRFTAWVNGTLIDVSDPQEIQNFIRYDINVSRNGVNVLTQQNFTYDGCASAAAPMYKIYYLVYLSGFHDSATKLMSEGFVAGQIYSVVVNCEIFGL